MYLQYQFNLSIDESRIPSYLSIDEFKVVPKLDSASSVESSRIAHCSFFQFSITAILRYFSINACFRNCAIIRYILYRIRNQYGKIGDTNMEYNIFLSFLLSSFSPLFTLYISQNSRESFANSHLIYR